MPMTTLSAGEEIKIARLRKHWTQAECAEELGVHRITLANWETGKNGPTPVNIGQIAGVLDIDPAVFATPASRSHAENFGRRLRAARVKENLSTEELGGWLNRSSRTIESWERGERLPNEENIKILERWLGTSLDLQSAKPAPLKTELIAADIGDAWHQLNPQQRALFEGKMAAACRAQLDVLMSIQGVVHAHTIDRAKASGEFPM